MDYFKENHSYLVGIALRVALGSLIYGLFRKWVSGGVCHSQAVLTGKTAIVTGANTGIGLETAVDLARRGASVILACRSVERGEKATVQVRKRSGNQNVIFANLDLASLDSIRAFANKILQKEIHIHILVNNGGVALASYQQTEDGFEMHMGTNHLGHFLLTNLLLPCLTLHPHARVVTVSSSRYKECLEFDFTGMEESKSDYKAGQAYCQSKLANILFTRSLAKRLEGTSVCAYALHPGVIFRTGLIRDFYRSLSFMKKALVTLTAYFFLKTPWQGAQTTIYCAVAEELEGVSGRYYGDCKEEKLVTAAAVDDEVAEKLWRVSAQMVGLEAQ